MKRERKPKPVWAWLCFVIGLSGILGMFLTGLTNFGEIVSNWDEISTVFSGDYRKTSYYREQLVGLFTDLQAVSANSSVLVNGDAENSEGEAATADEELVNWLSRTMDRNAAYLMAYTENRSSGYTWKYNETGLNDLQLSESELVIPSGAGLVLYWDGQELVGDESLVQYYETYYSWTNSQFAALDDCRTVLVINQSINQAELPSNSIVSLALNNMRSYRIVLWCVAAALLFFLLLFLYGMVRRQDRRILERKIGRCLGWFWFEVKTAVLLLLGSFCLAGILSAGRYDSTLMVVSCLCLFWLLYVWVVDMACNKKRYLTNNSVMSLIRQFGKWEATKPFHRAMMLRLLLLFVSELILLFLAGLSLFSTMVAGSFEAFLFFVLFMGIGIFLFAWFSKRYDRMMTDTGKLIDRITAIRAGEYGGQPVVGEDSDLYRTALDLEAIQEGMSRAVEETIKSERMKIELITNVSHDIKTPLTSIISYAELLKQEELPPVAEDYATIILRKAERLKTMVKDIFEVSKAASGNMELQFQVLELGKLMRQTMADMQEAIGQSGLLFRIDIPQEPAYIQADGDRLYRVFQNLLTNAIQYSLPGSRVYVELKQQEGRACVTVKNISACEMNFQGEEILERFVRGDSSRTTEGSGLGLSIAKEFTEICGGSFRVTVDADLFTARVCFPLTEERPPVEEADEGTDEPESGPVESDLAEPEEESTSLPPETEPVPEEFPAPGEPKN